MNSDNWKHRSDNMKCKTCMWFVPKMIGETRKEELGYDKGGDVYDMGRCRRHSPTMGGFPVVFVNDWCGDHRLDEDKFRANG